MKKYGFLVFFVLFATQNLFAEKYLNGDEVKELLNKIESASASSGQNQDLIQKELNEITNKTNLANQKRNLESSENVLGANEENTSKRVKSLQDYFSSTTAIDDFIYSDNFSYQKFCKGTVNCKAIAMVESEIFNQKMMLMNEKISSDKASVIKGLNNIAPMDDKLNILRQIEQSTYSINQNSMGLGNSSYNQFGNVDSNKKKKYIEIKDGDVLGNVKITVTENYIKLSKK